MVVNGNKFNSQASYDAAVKESTDKADNYCKEHKLEEGTDKYKIAFRNVFNLWMYACSDD